MKILVLGNGGREHALLRALSRDPQVSALHAAPGNAGMADSAALHPVDPTDGQAVVALARGGLPEVVGALGGITVPDPGPGGDAGAALAAVVEDAFALDRADVRADAVARLSFTAMLDAYEDLFHEMRPVYRRGRHRLGSRAFVL